MRKLLRELMSRRNNLVWYDQINLCCSIKNNQKNGPTKKRAIDVWQNTPYTRFQNYQNIDVRISTRVKARRDVAKNTTQVLNVCDHVRVKLSQLYSQVRKMEKQGDKKYIVVKYSPEIYIIDKVLKEDHEGLEKKRYTLKN